MDCGLSLQRRAKPPEDGEREEEWEEDRFIAASTGCRGLDARHMIEAIFAAADAFTGAAKQYDDMTLLVMKLQG